MILCGRGEKNSFVTHAQAKLPVKGVLKKNSGKKKGTQK